jgi:TP901 family phage tail tape measure protein
MAGNEIDIKITAKDLASQEIQKLTDNINNSFKNLNKNISNAGSIKSFTSQAKQGLNQLADTARNFRKTIGTSLEDFGNSFNKQLQQKPIDWKGYLTTDTGKLRNISKGLAKGISDDFNSAITGTKDTLVRREKPIGGEKSLDKFGLEQTIPKDIKTPKGGPFVIDTIADAASKSTGELAKFRSGIAETVKQMGPMAAAGMKVASSERLMADGSIQVVAGFEKLPPTMIQTMKELMNFQSMMAKVMHYITFSIGVQAVMGIKTAFSELTNTVTKFQATVINTTTVAGYFGAAFDDAAEKVRNLSITLSQKTIFSIIDTSEALWVVAQAGYDVTKMTSEGLLPVLNYAAATGIKLENAFMDVMSTAKAFGYSMDDTTEIVDTFSAAIISSFASAESLAESLKYVSSIAGELGQSLQTTVAALQVLFDRGIQGSQAGQRLAMVFTKLMDPTDEMTKRLNELGLTYTDINPAINDLTDILFKLKAANIQTADSALFFRARTAAAFLILLDEAKSMVRLRNEMLMMQGITQTLAQKQMATLEGRMKQVNNATLIAYSSFEDALAPAMTGIANIAETTLIPGLQDIGTALSGIAQLASYIGPYLQALASILIMIVPPLLIASLAGLAIGITNVKASFMGLFSTMLPIGILAMSMSTIFPQLNKSMSKLLIVIMASIIAYKMWRAHTLALMATKVKEFFVHMGIVTMYNANNMSLWTLIATTIKAKIVQSSFVQSLIAVTQGLALRLTVLYENILGLGLLTVATATATASSLLLAKVLIATGIGAIIVGIGIALAWAMDQWDGWSTSIENALGLGKVEIKLTEEQSTALTDYGVKLSSVNTILTEKIRLQGEVDRLEKETMDMQKDANKDIDVYKKKMVEYNKAINDLAIANKDWGSSIEDTIKAGQQVINILNNTSEDLNKAIAAEREYRNAKIKTRDIDEDIIEITKDQEEALMAYVDTVNEFGISSKEANNANEYYIELVKKQIGKSREYADAMDVMNDAQNNVAKSLETLNNSQKEYLAIAQSVMDAQDEVSFLYSELAEKTATLNLLQETQDHWLEMLTESTRDYWEKVLKVIDAETQLAILRGEQPGILEEIFNELANQGMINEEIIAQYVALEEAQAAYTVARMEYFDFVAGLSEQEQKDLAISMDYYDKLIKAGVDMATAYSMAFEGMTPGDAGIDLEALGITDPFAGMDTTEFDRFWASITSIDDGPIKAMSKAMFDMKSAVSKLGDTLGPLLTSLQDMGVLTKEQIEAFKEWVDYVPEVAQTSSDLKDKVEDLKKEFTDFLGIMARTWIATVQTGDTLSMTFNRLVLASGELQRALTSATGGTDTTSQLLFLNQLFGESKKSVDEFTQAQIVTAAAAAQMATSLGLTIGPATTLDGLLLALGAKSPLDSTKISVDKAAEVLNNLPTSIDGVKTAIGFLTTSMDLFRESISLTLEKIALLANPPKSDVGWIQQLQIGLNWATGGIVPLPELTPDQKVIQFNADVQTNQDNLDALDDKITAYYANKAILFPIDANTTPAETTIDKNLIKNPLLFPIGGNPFFVKAETKPAETAIEKLKFPIKYIDIYPRFHGFGGGKAEGGIIGAQTGMITKGPQVSLIGEAGAEAVVPLEGVNKKYGKKLLAQILPRYFPEFGVHQYGAIVGGGGNTSNNYNESYSINGPITVNGVQNVNDFMNQLKMRSRTISG